MIIMMKMIMIDDDDHDGDHDDDRDDDDRDHDRDHDDTSWWSWRWSSMMIIVIMTIIDDDHDDHDEDHDDHGTFDVKQNSCDNELTTDQQSSFLPLNPLHCFVEPSRVVTSDQSDQKHLFKKTFEFVKNCSRNSTSWVIENLICIPTPWTWRGIFRLSWALHEKRVKASQAWQTLEYTKEQHSISNL